MDHLTQIVILLFVVTFSITSPVSATSPAVSRNPVSRITVVGVVYCDTCQSNSFSRHSYFLPGAEVHIQCRFKATSPKTTEQMNFAVNRTTDKHGAYKLEIPHVDGVDCVDGMSISSFCQASLVGSSSDACNVPGLKTSTNEISVKSKQESLCIYSLNALSYMPLEKNETLCGKHNDRIQILSDSDDKLKTPLDESKFFFPYYIPGYGWFFWPPLPSFPLPNLPPLPFTPNPPSFPFPNLPPLPFTPSPPAFPFPNLPPLPFTPSPPALPFPNLPPLPFTPSPPPPSLPFPFPNLPPLPPFSYPPIFRQPTPPPPPPPAFNPFDPRTWGSLFPPQPPANGNPTP
ncbi:hypothetical protein ACFE04_024556 [Oxalis oulophora]